MRYFYLGCIDNENPHIHMGDMWLELRVGEVNNPARYTNFDDALTELYRLREKDRTWHGMHWTYYIFDQDGPVYTLALESSHV